MAVPLASALVLVCGWSALWVFARSEAQTVMDRWIAREAAHGRTWSCPDRTVEGFPLRIELACAHPRFAGRIGADIGASLGRLRAQTYLYEPSTLDVDLDGPLRIEAADARVAGTLGWARLHLTLRGLTADLKRADVVVDRPEWHPQDGVSGTADRLEVQVAPALGRPLADDADDIRLRLSRASVPDADALTGTSDPVDADASAAVTRVSSLAAEPLAASLEAWRAAGGSVEISSLAFDKGPVAITAAGTLGLDDAHRPAGRLQAGLVGIEPLAARLGIPMRALTVGGALARLLTKTQAGAPPTASGIKPSLTLPVILEGGHVFIGPLKTAVVMEPLY